MIISNWKYFLKSMSYFSKLAFVPKTYDVVFVYSSYFNRGENGDNLLFKPMIEFCVNNNINYTIIEDSDLKGAYDNFIRTKYAIPSDFILLFQILFRKLYNLKFKKPITRDELYFRESAVSKIVGNLFFRKFRSKVYITLIWDNVTLWRTINPNAYIVDYQHGIISDGDEAHISNGHPPKIKSENNVITLVYGEMFKKLLIGCDKSGFYNDENVVVVGLNKENIPKQGELTAVNNKKILFTLQITPDFKENEVNERYIAIVEKLIATNSEFLEKNNYEIIFRHHPRFNTINCNDISVPYKFVSFDNKTPMAELMKSVAFHITFHSTSALEAAMMGVPTVFIDMHDRLSPNKIFLEQYQYPCSDLVVKEFADLKTILLNNENNKIYSGNCKKVSNWSEKLYSQFDENKFKQFLFNKLEIIEN